MRLHCGTPTRAHTHTSTPQELEELRQRNAELQTAAAAGSGEAIGPEGSSTSIGGPGPVAACGGAGVVVGEKRRRCAAGGRFSVEVLLSLTVAV